MPSDFEITRRLEFDAGHRIPSHAHKCSRLHGHRYAIEATLRGTLRDVEGDSSFGMVEDFGNIKEVMVKYIEGPWDHRMLLWQKDPLFSELAQLPGSGVVALSVVPTSENLARLSFNILWPHLPQLVRVRIYETPNCWSDAGPLTNE